MGGCGCSSRERFFVGGELDGRRCCMGGRALLMGVESERDELLKACANEGRDCGMDMGRGRDSKDKKINQRGRNRRTREDEERFPKWNHQRKIVCPTLPTNKTYNSVIIVSTPTLARNGTSFRIPYRLVHLSSSLFPSHRQHPHLPTLLRFLTWLVRIPHPHRPVNIPLVRLNRCDGLPEWTR